MSQNSRTVRAGIAEWISLIRNVGENPVAQAFLLMQSRARKKKRAKFGPLTLGIITGGLVLVLGITITLYEYIDGRTFIGGQGTIVDYLPEFLNYLHAAFLTFLCTVTLAWFVEGLFNLFRDAVSVLGEPGLKTRTLVLDDLLASTTISNKEMLLGVLRVLLPPIWRRQLAFLGVTLWMYITVRAEFWHFSQIDADEWQVIKQILVLLPLTISSLLITGMLGATIYALYFIAVGRGLHSPLVGQVASALNTLFHLFYIMISGAISIALAIESGLAQMSKGIERLAQFGGIPLAIVILLFLVAMTMLLAQESRIARSIFAISGPVAFPGLLLLLCLILWGVAGAQNEDTSILLFVNGFWSLSGAAVVNPLAIPSPLCLGTLPDWLAYGSPYAYEGSSTALVGWEYYCKLLFPTYIMFEWFRYGALIILQLGLLFLVKQAALKAIATRRQA